MRDVLFQMADVLFFVLDSKTRAISSMIEVAYLVGKSVGFHKGHIIGKTCANHVMTLKVEIMYILHTA